MAGNANDERLYFAASLGRRLRLGVDTTARQTGDRIGVGKYLVNAVGLSTDSMGVKTVPWVDGATETHSIPAAPAAGATDFADGILLSSGNPSFILYVRKGVNDRLVAIMSANSATLEMTKVG
jgi:hypothetical protein